MATQQVWGPLKALLERLDEHGFGNEELQRLLENADILIRIGKGELNRAALLKVLPVVNPYRKERVKPSCFYPKGWKPTTVAEQVDILQRIYADLDSSQVVQIAGSLTVQVGADGLFVVPKLSVVGKKLGIGNPYGQGYGRLLEMTILKELGKQRKFHNWRAGELTESLVRVRESAVAALQKLEAETPGDFLVFSAQTGAKWAGYSPRNAHWEMEQEGSSEFPLSSWCVGHILYTNQSRLAADEHLAIDCAADEYRFEASGEFGLCLYFAFYDGELRFHYRWAGEASDYFGSSSGFLPR